MNDVVVSPVVRSVKVSKIIPNIKIAPLGAQGGPGEAGQDGSSAYEVWLAAGNVGSEQDFLISLIGEAGPQGEAGEDGGPGPQGAAGQNGQDGADGQGVPTGGAANQVLSKIDESDYNTQWVDPPSGGGIPGGASAQIQFNANGSFSGDGNFVYDSNIGQLKIDSKSAENPALVVEGQGSTTPIAKFQRSGGGISSEMTMITSGLMGLRWNGNIAVGGTALREDIVLQCGKNVTNPTTAQTGANFSLTFRPLSGVNSQRVTGGGFNVSIADSNNATAELRGGYFSCQNNNTATVTKPRAGEFLLYNIGVGAITNGHGVLSVLQQLNVNGSVSDMRLYEAKVGFQRGTVNNLYGFYCGDLTDPAGTYTNTPYSFYASDEGADNHFAGKVGVGSGNDAPTADLDVGGDHIRIRTAKTPSSPNDTGNQGDVAWDNDFIYVCISTNTWKRTALTSW